MLGINHLESSVFNMVKKRGIFTMANYLSDYPLIDKLKGIKGFEYREEVQYA